MSRSALHAVATLLLLGLAGGCREREPPPLRVFAGSANRPALERIAALWEAEGGAPIETIYGGSGTVLSQLQLAGRGDVYLPGSQDFMERAEALGQVRPETIAELAWLVPALIVPEGNPAGIESLEDLTRPGLRVGIGNPDSVCLGSFAIELLEYNGLLERVFPNVVAFGASCSGVADMAAIGSAEVVIGWRVVERWNPERLDRVELEPHQIPRISAIPIAVTTHSERPALASALVDLARSTEGLQAYAEAGYLTRQADALRLAPQAQLGGSYALPEGWLSSIGRGGEE